MPKKNFIKENNINNKESLDYFLHLAEESRVFLHKDKNKLTGLEAAFFIFLYHRKLNKKFQTNYYSILNDKTDIEFIPYDFCNILNEIIFIKKDIKKWINKNK